jgi:REP element-mobilizing transposase RayT
MARPLRLCFEGATYHITARGMRKERLFRSNRDRRVFLERMSEALSKYEFVCYAYCLMPNHYHLFMMTPLSNLPDGLHYLNASYANWFRTKYDLAGPVFQGRYKSMLVDADNYALAVSAYIHLNPVRAHLARSPEDYEWSSFQDYTGSRRSIFPRLDTSFILRQFGDDTDAARVRYRSFVEARRTMGDPLTETYRGIAVGDESFVEEIERKLHQLGTNREIGATKGVASCTLEDIVSAAEDTLGMDRDRLLRRRRGNRYRALALYLAKKHCALSLRDIGEFFDLDYAAVSQAARRFEQALDRDRELQRLVSSVETLLKTGSGLNI